MSTSPPRPSPGPSPRIHLVQVPFFHSDRPGINTPLWPPLSLGVLTAALREAGYPVSPVDLNIEIHLRRFRGEEKAESFFPAWFRDESRVRNFLEGAPDQELERATALLLGDRDFSSASHLLLSSPRGMDFSPLGTAVCLARYLRGRTRARILLGGCWELPEIFSLALASRAVDGICLGSGESFLLEYLARDRRGWSPSADDPSPLPRLAWCDGIKVHVPPPAPPDTPRLPDFSGLPLHLYAWNPRETFCREWNPSSPPASHLLVLPYRFQLGCRGNCAFCACGDGTHMALPPAAAAGHVAALAAAYGTPCFRFAHNAINQSREQTAEFCRALIATGLPLRWLDCGRFHDLDQELLGLLRRAGAVRLIFGLETASPRLLRATGKGLSPDRVSCLLRAADAAGIWTGIEIIAGLPHERDEDIDHTIRFLRAHRSCIDEYHLTPFKMREHSRMQLEPEEFGIEGLSPDRRFARFSGGSLPCFHENLFRFSEKNGLSWEEKQGQIWHSYRRLAREPGLRVTNRYSDYDQVQALCYCYSRHRDKRDIRLAYRRYRNLCRARYLRYQLDRRRWTQRLRDRAGWRDLPHQLRYALQRLRG